MREKYRSGIVVACSLLIGGIFGAGTEYLSPRFESFLGVSSVVVFGLGIAVVEGPTLIVAIFLARKVTRAWVRNALQASAPFLGFFAYLLAYGYLRNPFLGLPLPR